MLICATCNKQQGLLAELREKNQDLARKLGESRKESDLRLNVAGHQQVRAEKAEAALLAEKVMRINEYARADGLIQWLKNPSRSAACTAFTAGTERQVAYAVEALLDKVLSQARAEMAGLRQRVELFTMVAKSMPAPKTGEWNWPLIIAHNHEALRSSGGNTTKGDS